MKKNSDIIEIIEIYENNIATESISFDGYNLIFKFKSNALNSETALNKIFNVDKLLNGNISIELKNLKTQNLYVYNGIDNYLNDYDNYKNSFDDSQILIFNNDNKTVFKDTNESFIADKAIVFNNVFYHHILNLLKECKSFSNIKSIDNEIIVVSKTNGVIHLGYNFREYRINDLEDLKSVYETLKTRFYKSDLIGKISENTEFIKLFIETIATSGIGKYKKNEIFFEFLKEFKILISFTERDYDNYINEFSFENIKTKFKEERNKYFEGLEKNIELVSKQVLSFPLTFAATAFASYQVKDDVITLGLILMAFFLYSVVALKILNISRYNIECIEKDVDAEKKQIEKDYIKNFEYFSDDFDKINSKLIKIKSLICWLKLILISMFCLFLLFAGYEFCESKNVVKEKEVLKQTNDKIYYCTDKNKK